MKARRNPPKELILCAFLGECEFKKVILYPGAHNSKIPYVICVWKDCCNQQVASFMSLSR